MPCSVPSKHKPLPRQVQISKALSRLLRHAALDEGVPIDEHGWVRCDDLLKWRKVKGMRVGLDEVVEVVRVGMAEGGKGRFGLRFGGAGDGGGEGHERDGSAEGDGGVAEGGVDFADGVQMAAGEGKDGVIPMEQLNGTGLEQAEDGAQQGKRKGKARQIDSGEHVKDDTTDREVPPQPNLPQLQESTVEKGTENLSHDHPAANIDTTSSPTETSLALSHFTSNPTNQDPAQYFIRATQGHSIPTILPDQLLTPINLDDPASIPETVVHGTFYSAWSGILASKGLKRMGRNYVHFSGGPPLHAVLEAVSQSQEHIGNGEGEDVELSQNGKEHTAIPRRTFSLAQLMADSKVRSGMRPTAELLIYIDLPRALRMKPGVKWWRSENGVILSEGEVENQGQDEVGNQTEVRDEGEGKGQRNGVVGMEVWQKVVDVGGKFGGGGGVVWEEGNVLKELPERYRGARGRGGRGGSGRGDGGGSGSGRGRGREARGA